MTFGPTEQSAAFHQGAALLCVWGYCQSNLAICGIFVRKNTTFLLDLCYYLALRFLALVLTAKELVWAEFNRSTSGRRPKRSA